MVIKRAKYMDWKKKSYPATGWIWSLSFQTINVKL
jgi:hypothetical protein